MKLTSDNDKNTENHDSGSLYYRLAESLARPYAAPRLLYSLAILLILFLFGWVVFYWVANANEDISVHRRIINTNYVAVRDFFERNELWLSHLKNAIFDADEVNKLSSVNEPSSKSSSRKNKHSTVTASQNHNSIEPLFKNLTQSNKDLLNGWSASLLYVNSALHQVQFLYKNAGFIEEHERQPKGLWSFLNSAKNYSKNKVNHLVWFFPKSDEYSRIYVFIDLDNKDINNRRWLGMQLHAEDVQSVLQKTLQNSYSGYILRRHDGFLLFEDGPSNDIHRASATNIPFGYDVIPFGGLNRFLTLKLRANANDWTITQYVDLFSVLGKSLRKKIIFGLLLQLLASSILLLIVREVDRRILVPAQLQNERIIESEAFSSAIIDTAPVGICVIRHGAAEVVLENQLARSMLSQAGQTEPANNRPALLQAYRRRIKSSDSFELSLGEKNERHVLIAFANTRYQGSPVLLCTLSDISTRKQTEAALADAKRDSDEANKAKSSFLATISHEIRTPLYGVLGTLELLALTELYSEQRQHLETMQASSNTLLQLINDVLDLSKIEAGQMTIECIEFDPIVLVETVARVYAPVAQRKELKLYCCIDSKLPLYLFGDPLRLQQILGNLLSNAVKFTDAGNVVVRMDLLDSDEDNLIVALQVSDSGVGISETEQQRLFEPFSQVGKNSLQRFGGTGLGLSICRQLSELMGGSISVFSRKGSGSSFIAKIYLNKAQSATRSPLPALADKPVYLYGEMLDVCESLAGWINLCGARAIILVSISELYTMDIPAGSVLVQMSGSPEENPHKGLSGYIYTGIDKIPAAVSGELIQYASAYNLRALLNMIMRKQCQSVLSKNNKSIAEPVLQKHLLKVLVAEDHPINQMLLKSQLEILGCDVSVAKDGEEALVLWQEDKFDLVLTDINMPQMNGYELTKKLRQMGVTVPIVGVTANVLREEIERCYASGMSSHLAKPVSLNGLEQMLNKIDKARSIVG